MTQTTSARESFFLDFLPVQSSSTLRQSMPRKQQISFTLTGLTCPCVLVTTAATWKNIDASRFHKSVAGCKGVRGDSSTPDNGFVRDEDRDEALQVVYRAS